MSTEIIVAALASGGLGAILVAVINGIFSKRKLGAEATEIITRAAAGVVESLEGQLRAQRELAQIQAAAFTNQRAEWKRAWDQHIAWDDTVIQILAQEGIELPPAPDPPSF